MQEETEKCMAQRKEIEWKNGNGNSGNWETNASRVK